MEERPQSGRCQVPGCEANLAILKGYYRRYRICKEHASMPEMMWGGVVSRFCQQCASFQPLTDFEGNKSSCRAILARHNERRAKKRAQQRPNNGTPRALLRHGGRDMRGHRIGSDGGDDSSGHSMLSNPDNDDLHGDIGHHNDYGVMDGGEYLQVHGLPQLQPRSYAIAQNDIVEVLPGHGIAQQGGRQVAVLASLPAGLRGAGGAQLISLGARDQHQHDAQRLDGLQPGQLVQLPGGQIHVLQQQGLGGGIQGAVRLPGGGVGLVQVPGGGLAMATTGHNGGHANNALAIRALLQQQQQQQQQRQLGGGKQILVSANGQLIQVQTAPSQAPQIATHVPRHSPIIGGAGAGSSGGMVAVETGNGQTLLIPESVVNGGGSALLTDGEGNYFVASGGPNGVSIEKKDVSQLHAQMQAHAQARERERERLQQQIQGGLHRVGGGAAVSQQHAALVNGLAGQTVAIKIEPHHGGGGGGDGGGMTTSGASGGGVDGSPQLSRPGVRTISLQQALSGGGGLVVSAGGGGMGADGPPTKRILLGPHTDGSGGATAINMLPMRAGACSGATVRTAGAASGSGGGDAVVVILEGGADGAAAAAANMLLPMPAPAPAPSASALHGHADGGGSGAVERQMPPSSRNGSMPADSAGAAAGTTGVGEGPATADPAGTPFGASSPGLGGAQPPAGPRDADAADGGRSTEDGDGAGGSGKHGSSCADDGMPTVTVTVTADKAEGGTSGSGSGANGGLQHTHTVSERARGAGAGGGGGLVGAGGAGGSISHNPTHHHNHHPHAGSSGETVESLKAQVYQLRTKVTALQGVVEQLLSLSLPPPSAAQDSATAAVHATAAGRLGEAIRLLLPALTPVPVPSHTSASASAADADAAGAAGAGAEAAGEVVERLRSALLVLLPSSSGTGGIMSMGMGMDPSAHNGSGSGADNRDSGSGSGSCSEYDAVVAALRTVCGM